MESERVRAISGRVFVAWVVVVFTGSSCVRAIQMRPKGTFTGAFSKGVPLVTLDNREAPPTAPGGTLLFEVEDGGVDLDDRWVGIVTGLDERVGEDHRIAEWHELTDRDLELPVNIESRNAPGGPALDGGPWDRAYQTVIAAYADPSDNLESLEPDFEEVAEAASTRERTDVSPPVSATLGAPASSMWPGNGVCWSHGDKYSQLHQAQELVASHPEWLRVPVQIAHLDTGYAGNDPLRPPTLNLSLSLSFMDGGTGEAGDGHGNHTLSALAGGKVQVSDSAGIVYDGYLGANPFAQVREYQISASSFTAKGGASIGPVHLGPKRMATAIAYAAKSGVDVLSVSAGGFPSSFQAWAIDYAYDHGTAIFAATGDYISVPFLPISSPSVVVYPANFERVIGVAGVTAAGRSYGLAPCYFCLFTHSDWFEWMFRGSYGPGESMRGHVVAGYAPNISHSSATGAVNLNGGGTSHATPQVAGAAGLWLAAHRGDIPANKWSTWEKTEAVYQAVLRSADKQLPEYELETMGEGVMRAKAMLDTHVPANTLQRRAPSKIDPFWLIKGLITIGIIKLPPGRVGLAQMATTEVRQIAYRSKGVRNQIAKLDLNERRDQKVLAEELLDSGEASDQLTAWLKAFLETP